MSAAAEPLRLQKFLAEAGVCSRRAAETLIREGEVWVNGQVATLGQRVTPGQDKVTVNGSTVRTKPVQALTLAMHKPRGFVCTNSDPHEARTVFTLLPKELAKLRLFCAGRLDKDSEGLLILTSDGDLANRLMHPSRTVTKLYHVLLEHPYPLEKIPRLLRGVVVDGERLKVEHAYPIKPNAGVALSWDIHMHHGKKREIRQLFRVVGYEVKRLKRYQIGAFPLKGIPKGISKILSPRDIEKLFAPPPIPPAVRRAIAARSATTPTATEHSTLDED